MGESFVISKSVAFVPIVSHQLHGNVLIVVRQLLPIAVRDHDPARSTKVHLVRHHLRWGFVVSLQCVILLFFVGDGAHDVPKYRTEFW